MEYVEGYEAKGPRPLDQVFKSSILNVGGYDVSPDGQRFLVLATGQPV